MGAGLFTMANAGIQVVGPLVTMWKAKEPKITGNYTPKQPIIHSKWPIAAGHWLVSCRLRVSVCIL